MWPFSKNWDELAGDDPTPTPAERKAQAVLVDGERGIQPTDALATTGNIQGPGGVTQMQRRTWHDPPVRGVADLMVAYVVSPPLRAVVELVADAFAMVDWYTGTLEEPDTDHPGVRMLYDMNPQLVGMDGRKLVMIHLMTAGEAIIVKIPTGRRDKPFDLYPLNPAHVRMESSESGTLYIYRANGAEFIFPESSVLHPKMVNPADVYGRGRGPGFALADEIESWEYQAKHIKSYFWNSTQPEMIFAFDGVDQKVVEAYKAAFDEKHRGFRKHWSPAWFGRDVNVIELTRKLGEERIEELRNAWVDIARYVYRVPPEVIGKSIDANRASIKESSQHLGLYVTNPKCKKIQEFWNLKVMPMFGRERISYVSPVPKVFDRRDEIMSRHPYAFLRNEIRQEAGFAPRPDGDTYPVPTNLEITDATRTLRDARDGESVLRLVAEEAAAE